jgi:hypothetical protein
LQKLQKVFPQSYETGKFCNKAEKFQVNPSLFLHFSIFIKASLNLSISSTGSVIVNLITIKPGDMKRCYSLIFSMIFFTPVFAQVKGLEDKSTLSDHANKTLKATTEICAISFLSQAIGGSLILAGMDMDTDREITLLAAGLFIGIGGVGTQTNNAILANRAYEQIKMLEFRPEDSLLQCRILKNIKSARTLSIIQNITPIVAVTAGAISYSVYKSKYQDYYEAFFESRSFWIPAVSICLVGAILSIPEIVLIEKARSDLNSYQKKLSFGTTKYGLGVSYRF